MIELMSINSDNPNYSTVELAFSNDDVEVLQSILDYWEAKKETERLKRIMVEKLEIKE